MTDQPSLRPRSRWVFAITLIGLSASPLLPVGKLSRKASATSLDEETRARVAPIVLPPPERLAPEPSPVSGGPPSELPAPVVKPERETVRVTLYNVNSEEEITLDLPVDGLVEPDVAQELAHFFRCRRRGREKPMSAGVLRLLASVARQFPGRPIEIISGYRSPPYGVKRSKHFQGNAIDLRVRGVRLTRVRDAVWTTHTGIGVGWYPEKDFIHIDYRPDEPDMSWTARGGEGSPYRYHPSWAERAREKARAQADGPAAR